MRHVTTTTARTLTAKQTCKVLLTFLTVVSLAATPAMATTLEGYDNTIGELEDELKHAAEGLRRMRTQTQIVEKLRERRWAAYRKQRDRREQNESDELARQLLYEPDRSVLDRIG